MRLHRLLRAAALHRFENGSMFIDGAGARPGQHQYSGECTRQLSADQRDKIAAALMLTKHDPIFGVNAGFLALFANMTTASSRAS
jgi:hypothetical protein